MQHEKKKSQKFYYKKNQPKHQPTANPTENNNPTKMLRQILIHNPTETVLQENNNNKSTNYICTNQRTIGLISADRSNKATLLLTIPRSKFKSSAKDLSSLIFEVIIQGIR